MPKLTSLLKISLLCSIFTVGCGTGIETDYSNVGLIPVSGTIKLDGQPVEDAVVFFEAPDRGFSFATTDSNGYYNLKFNSEINGIVAGPKTVRISTTASTGEIGNPEEGDGEGDEEEGDEGEPIKGLKNQELFPAQYNKDSQLQVEVTDDTNEFNFDLNSDGSTTAPAA